MEFEFNKYNLDLTGIIHKVTKNDMTCICNTCHSYLKKSHISAQPVCHKLQIFEVPAEIKNLNRLERILTTRRILFKKVTIMPKSQFPKLKGAICNIAIDTSDITNVLPHGADSSGLIMVKLKRKLSFRDHVCFSPVSPESIYLTLSYLKVKNPYYKNVTIDTLPSDLTDLVDQSEVNCPGPSDTLEEDENPQHQFQYNSHESLLIPDIPSLKEISIAPGEGKKPNSLISDENCEALAFPYLFPTEEFGYNIQRDVKLSPVRHFNQRLLNFTQLFASEADYIFYTLSVTQQLKLNIQINIALKKFCSGHVTAGMLSRNFTEAVKSILTKDDAYQFMDNIKGTHAYWKKFLFEVLAMVKQLGLPAFFMTLSYTNLRWDGLISIIASLRGKNLQDEDIQNMDFLTCCSYFNLSPVLLARHFQYRVETFFQVIVLDGPSGKVKQWVSGSWESTCTFIFMSVG